MLPVQRLARFDIAAVIVAAYGLATAVSAQQDHSWTAGNGNWSSPFNWLPLGAPGLFDNAFIGNISGVQDSTVLLDAGLSNEFVFVDTLTITSGMTIDANNRGLFANQTFLNDGTIIVRPATLSNFGIFPDDGFGSRVAIGSAGHLRLEDGSAVFDASSFNSGLISGRGEIVINPVGLPGQIVFRNEGIMAPDGNGGIEITTLESNGLRDSIDLDGIAEQGTIDLTTPFSILTVTSGGLTDAFDGDVFLGVGAAVLMNTGDWSVGDGGVFTITGANNIASSQIAGDHVEFGGALQFNGVEPKVRFGADATLTSTASASVTGQGLLEFDGNTTVEGGLYQMVSGNIQFDGQTTVQGGTFTAPGVFNTGVVSFNGQTVWDGGADIEKTAVQNGNASVAGFTTINAGTFDMDGLDDNTAWNIGSTLTINADQINTGASLTNQFNGTLNISGGFLSRLIMNITDAAPWTMNGTMNLEGDLFGLGPATRVVGSPMRVTGTINVDQGSVAITSDALFTDPTNPGTINITGDFTDLHFTGTSRFAGNTQFLGDRGIVNSGHMTMLAGVNMNDLGLINEGILTLGTGSDPALVTTDVFGNAPSGTLNITLGGYAMGDEHDALLITGGITSLLGGTLTVDIVDLDLTDDDVFRPIVGDEFVIISALSDIAGQFENQPVSLADGLIYQWTIDYEPNATILRLESIVPSPGSASLAMLTGGLLARRRRR